MTIRNKEFGVKDVTQWATGTHGFRILLLILVLSMHPIGRGLLSSFGFKFPDEQKITVAAEQAFAVKTDVTKVQLSVDEIRKDVDGLKQDASQQRANYAIINTKLDKLSTDFGGFQIEFRKHQPSPP